MTCPRCQSAEEYLRIEYQGCDENGNIMWTVYHCDCCSFTWRDSEDPESIDYDQRPAWSRIDPDNFVLS